MMYIACILWVLIWGLAGYFTVRAYQVHVESKRWEKYMKGRNMYPPIYIVKKSEEKVNNDKLTGDPFENLL